MKWLHCLEIACFLFAGLHLHDVGQWVFAGFIVAGWVCATIRESDE